MCILRQHRGAQVRQIPFSWLHLIKERIRQGILHLGHSRGILLFTQRAACMEAQPKCCISHGKQRQIKGQQGRPIDACISFALTSTGNQNALRFGSLQILQGIRHGQHPAIHVLPTELSCQTAACAVSGVDHHNPILHGAIPSFIGSDDSTSAVQIPSLPQSAKTDGTEKPLLHARSRGTVMTDIV